MARVYRILMEACWSLGVLSLVIAVLLKLLPAWADMFREVALEVFGSFWIPSFSAPRTGDLRRRIPTLVFRPSTS